MFTSLIYVERVGQGPWGKEELNYHNHSSGSHQQMHKQNCI